MKRLGVAVTLLLCACGDNRPAALVADADPFLLNGPGPVRLPVRVVSATGRTLPDVPIAATSDADSVATAPHGALRCHQHGDARIAIAAGSHAASTLVQCRPVKSFAPFPYVELEVDGPPAPIPVIAYAANRRRMTGLRYSATPEDTTVAIMRDGLVVPRALGRTRLVLDFGGLPHIAGVTVVIPHRADTVDLAAGEYRRWPLGPGRFRISAHAPDGSTRATGVTLRAVNANCARDPLLAETIHCVLADSGEVVAIATRGVGMILRIVRMPE